MTGIRMILMLSLAMVAVGCGGSRFSLFDKQTPEGIWTKGGHLVRMYEGMNFRQAVEGIDAYLKDKQWQPKRRDVDARDADIHVTDANGVDIDFNVWAPKDKPYVEVGVKVGRDERFRSAKILDELEKHLPGRRIQRETD